MKMKQLFLIFNPIFKKYINLCFIHHVSTVFVLNTVLKYSIRFFFFFFLSEYVFFTVSLDQ